jgi:hypothetical protein
MAAASTSRACAIKASALGSAGLPIQFRQLCRQPVLGRQAGKFVVRRQPRHGDGAVRQSRQRIGGKIGRGDKGDSLADENAQAQS